MSSIVAAKLREYGQMDISKCCHVEDVARVRYEHRLDLPAPTHDGGWCGFTTSPA
jgi:hypothetical protein